MAAVFDLSHDPLHTVAGVFGILGLPIAAMLISVSLSRTPPWAPAKGPLFWTANLTWATVPLLAATFALFIVTYVHAGGDLNAPAPEVVPTGVLAWVGWANRLLVVFYCAWVMTVAWHAVKLQAREIGASNYRPATYSRVPRGPTAGTTPTRGGSGSAVSYARLRAAASRPPALASIVRPPRPARMITNSSSVP